MENMGTFTIGLLQITASVMTTWGIMLVFTVVA